MQGAARVDKKTSVFGADLKVPVRFTRKLTNSPCCHTSPFQLSERCVESLHAPWGHSSRRPMATVAMLSEERTEGQEMTAGNSEQQSGSRWLRRRRAGSS